MSGSGYDIMTLARNFLISFYSVQHFFSVFFPTPKANNERESRCRDWSNNTNTTNTLTINVDHMLCLKIIFHLIFYCFGVRLFRDIPKKPCIDLCYTLSLACVKIPFITEIFKNHCLYNLIKFY
jgi:hypothetical protein